MAQFSVEWELTFVLAKRSSNFGNLARFSLPPQVGKVWNFVGSTAGVLVLYIYPSAFYLRLRYVRYRKRAQRLSISILSQYNWSAVVKEAIAWVILLIGLVLLVVENYQAIYAVSHSGGGQNSTCTTNSSNAAGTCYTLFCEAEGNLTRNHRGFYNLYT